MNETSTDITALIEQADAADALFRMFRQGFSNGIHIPQVETDAEHLAHIYLGCDTFNALQFVYAAALGARDDDEYADVVEIFDTVDTIADDYLRTQVAAVIAARGPVGGHTCKGVES